MSRIPVAPSEEPIENNGKIETPSRGNEVSVDAVEVPYTDYKNQYNHPYTVDYFKLGDRWQDPVGGFEKEVFLIENYIDNKIQGGEIANSVQAIKDMIKKMEKFNNIDALNQFLFDYGTSYTNSINSIQQPVVAPEVTALVGQSMSLEQVDVKGVKTLQSTVSATSIGVKGVKNATLS